MGSRHDELERFKHDIDLRVYAADCGYQVSHARAGPTGPLPP